MDASRPHRVAVTARFLVCTLVACCVCSFAFGKLGRMLVLSTLHPISIRPESNNDEVHPSLPTPTAKGEKEVPHTLYTTKNFDTRSSVISSQFLKKEDQSESSLESAPRNEKLVQINETDYEYDADEEEHLPAGQHLLIDIDNVDGSFLNSEKRLATAMLQLVDNSGLTLLSYHCHGLQPAGVTCVGVLLESHVSFHTWPDEGVITLDLFTCGANSLLNHLQLIQGLFAVPRPAKIDHEPPHVLWAYKRRGFNYPTRSGEASRDTFAYPLGVHGMELKTEIARVVTSQGKQGWIYDVHEISGDTNRLFFLNGVLKANTISDSASHESFVHPPMFAHSGPKRVLVVGATTGATVREVLKHESVKEVSVVGVDKALLDLTKEHLPNSNDCSDFLTHSSQCLDDPRVKTYYEEPRDWLQSSSSERKGSFDVVLVDLLELEEQSLAELTFQSDSFVSSLQDMMSEHGVVALQISQDLRAVDSPLRSSQTQQGRVGFVDNVQSCFEATRHYNEFQTGFPDSRNYVVGFMDAEESKNWNRNEAQINRAILNRSVRTHSGELPLNFFDGAAMASYNKFTQGIEGCEQHPQPRWCEMGSLHKPPQHFSSETQGKQCQGVVIPDDMDSNASFSQGSQCVGQDGGEQKEGAWGVDADDHNTISRQES